MKCVDRFYKEIIFSAEDVRDLYNSLDSEYNMLTYNVKTGKICRIRRDLYATIDPLTKRVYANKFEIASKVTKTDYVSYHSALEYHGLNTQVFRTVDVSGGKRFSNFSFDGVFYCFHSNNFAFGVQEDMQNSIVRVTNVERTILDCIDCIDLAGGIEELIYAIDSVPLFDESLLLKYLDSFNLKNLFKKTGYLLSIIKGSQISDFFYNYCKSKIGNGRSYLLKNGSKSILSSEWGLIVPTELLKYIKGVE